jgi:hypothetical protein
MNLVALVMDPCESLQGGSDIVLETRQPGLSEEREFDWTGLISNDPQVSHLLSFFFINGLDCSC